MQLQAANLVYIFDVIILSVTANKSGRLTVETSFLPLNSQASSYKVHSREITYKSSKGEQQFLNARHPLDLLYIYTIYYQNISKDIKVIERTSFPLKNSFKGDNSKNIKGEQPFLHATHRLHLIYMHAKYYQNISKGIKVIKCTCFPL